MLKGKPFLPPRLLLLFDDDVALEPFDDFDFLSVVFVDFSLPLLALSVLTGAIFSFLAKAEAERNVLKYE